MRPRLVASAGILVLLLALGYSPGRANLALGQPSCLPPPSGSIGWWPGDRHSQDLVGSNHATLQNGAGYASGQVDRSFQLDGVNDYVRVPDAASLRPANLTLEGWFNFSDLSGTRMLMSKTFGTGPGDTYAIWWQSGTISVASACPANSCGGHVFSVPFTPIAGTWYHIAYTFDDAANTHALFINGVLYGSGTITDSLAYDNHPHLAGAEIESEVVTVFFAGRIDELTMYDRALSAAEIQAIYNAGAQGKCEPDPDLDDDGVATRADNCPIIANPGQLNADGDSNGDACDDDDDNDTILDASDPCPTAALISGIHDGLLMFSTTSTSNPNPGSPWQYGWKPNLGGAFTLYNGVNLFHCGNQMLYWYDSTTDRGVIGRSKVGTTFSCGSPIIHPDTVFAGPGPGGELATLRWVAPVGGTYYLTAEFLCQDASGPTNADVHVLKNGTSLYDDIVSGPCGAATRSYAALVTVAAGDAIDFAVGQNGGGNTTDSTGIKARLYSPDTDCDTIPDASDSCPTVALVSGAHDALAVFSASSIANPRSGSPWQYGWKPNLGGALALYDAVNLSDCGDKLLYWYNSTTDRGVIGRSKVDDAFTCGAQRINPDRVLARPGPAGELATLRWVAPVAGSFYIVAEFSCQAPSGALNVDVHVLKNGISLFNDIVSGPCISAIRSYSGTVTVVAGDTVDFAVGPNGPWDDDHSGIKARLYPVDTNCDGFGGPPTLVRGDCNADNVVNSADVSGLVLEIFDGDGDNANTVSGGAYPGDVNGCDANADAKVDAGDLSCVARLLFGGGGCAP